MRGVSNLKLSAVYHYNNARKKLCTRFLNLFKSQSTAFLVSIFDDKFSTCFKRVTFYDWPTFYEADFANKITVCSYSNETGDFAPVIYFQQHVVADQRVYSHLYLNWPIMHSPADANL